MIFGERCLRCGRFRIFANEPFAPDRSPEYPGAEVVAVGSWAVHKPACECRPGAQATPIMREQYDLFACGATDGNRPAA